MGSKLVCQKCGIEKTNENSHLLDNSYCSTHKMDEAGFDCEDCFNPMYRYCVNHRFKKKYLCCWNI